MYRKKWFLSCAFVLFLHGGSAFSQQSCNTPLEITAEQLSKEQNSVQSLLKDLKKGDFFALELQRIEAGKSGNERIAAYKSLAKQVVSVLQIQAELNWLDLQTVKAALDAMKMRPDFDSAKAESKYKELISLVKQGFNGIYQNDKNAWENAQKALKLKKELMLLSPDVMIDRLLTVKYELGERAPFVMAESLGVQPNNWSNQTSASRNNFKAELMEVSGLKSGRGSR